MEHLFLDENGGTFCVYVCFCGILLVPEEIHERKLGLNVNLKGRSVSSYGIIWILLDGERVCGGVELVGCSMVLVVRKK